MAIVTKKNASRDNAYTINIRELKEMVAKDYLSLADKQVLEDHGYTLLRVAMRRNDKGLVEALLGKGVDPNSLGANGNTALHFAAIERRSDMFSLLLRYGANGEIRNSKGKAPFDIAEDIIYSQKENAEEAKNRLQTWQKELDQQLLDATKNYNKSDMELALDRLANVNVQDEKGNTPLHIAVMSCHYELVKMLKTSGALDGLPNKQGVTVKGFLKLRDEFLQAAKDGDLNKLDEALKKGMEVDIYNEDGMTALHFASYNGHVNLVERLLKEGASLNIADKNGNRAIHLSAFNNGKITDLLLESGASYKVRNKQGVMPIHYASLSNDSNSLRFLVEKDPTQVNVQDKMGNTPLHNACISNGEIEFLMQNGADASIKNKRHAAPLEYKKMRENWGAEIIKNQVEAIKNLFSKEYEGGKKYESGKTFKEKLHSQEEAKRLVNLQGALQI